MEIAKRIFKYSLGFALAAGLILYVYGPNARGSNEVVEISGIVDSISAGGDGDVALHLADDPDHVYYLNRATHHGLDVLSLRNATLQRRVVLRFLDHWSILNFRGRMKPTYSVRLANGELIYQREP